MLDKTRYLMLVLLLFAKYVGASPITLLESCPFINGIVVHLGCGNGRTSEALSLNGRFFVHALDTNPQQVNQAKQRLGQSNRVYVDLYNGKQLPYADNLINVIVVDPSTTIAKQELKRVLQPLGWIISKSGNRWIKTVKAWPQGMDQWTHYLHGPDNNAVAQDAEIGPPRYLRWMSDPVWSRHHDVNPSMTGLVSAQGRLYTINDETPIGFGPSVTDQWFLVAQDAFNGTVLWKRPIPHWGQKTWAPYEGGYAERFNHPLLTKRLVAVGDHVYVTLGYNAPVSIISGASGDLIGTLEDSEKTDEILVDEHRIFLSINLKERLPNSHDPAVKQHRVATYDRYSGKQAWSSGLYTGVAPKKGHFQQITHLFMAVGETSLYLIDKNSILALDKTTGQQRWQAALPVDTTMHIHYDFNSQGMCKILATANHVLVCQLDTEETADKKKGFRQPWTRPTRSKIRAYDSKTGRIQWTIDAGNWGHYSLPELFVLNNQLRAHHSTARRLLTVDLNSGKTVASRSTEDAFDNKHHHRCYENRATSRYLISSFRGLEYLAWDSNETDHNHWLRGSCQLGIFPCNGLTYVTPHPCDCYVSSKFNGLGAFSTRTTSNPLTAPLTKGPAYKKVVQSIASVRPSDWPSYRHDNQRSSYTPARLSAALTKAWTKDCQDTGLTAPVVAQGRILLGSMETGNVYCLDLETGQVNWRYTTSGPIDSPPSFAGNLAVVGSRDGSVYCLDAATGQLVWRYRCGPMVRYIAAFGRLESSWPVHGSVLVQDNTVYAVAGRSGYIDGGFFLYELALETGELLRQKQIASPAGEKKDWGRDPDRDYGLLSDILVAQDKHIFMRQRSIFGKAYTGPVWGGHLTSWSGLLDDSWFNRSVWLLDGIPYGELLAYSDQLVCGIRAYAKRGSKPMFEPGQEGYLLFGAKRKPLPTHKKGWISHTSLHPENNLWEQRITTRLTGFVLTDTILFGVGTPDRIDTDTIDQWASYKGQKEGVLAAFDANTGQTLAQIELDSGPVYDGMAASNGRLVIALNNGTVQCCASPIDK
jgi:outer membrane protein assembly factor BamB/SAM-dependent methyltransferase